MAFVVADRVKETTTTVGTGAVALAGAVTGFRTFASGIGNSNTTYYTIASQTANEWEVGFGTLDATSANLARTTVLASSNGGSLVTFSAGTKDVFVTQSAARTLVQASGGTTTNGVLYYTGSGVATGGSALTWDTSQFKVTVASATAGASLISSGNFGVRSGANSTNGAIIEGVDNTGASSYQPLYIGGSDLRFTNSGTEQMRLTSTGLGIGTSSPAVKLQVVSASGGTTSRFTNVNTGNFIDFYESNTSTRLGLIGTTDGTNWSIHNDKNGYIGFDTNNIERMRLDSSGNLGIGTSSPTYRVDIDSTNAGGNILSGTRGTSQLVAYQSASSTGYFGMQSNNNLIFITNGTNRATLDTSGNLGLGTTSPGVKLDVNIGGTPASASAGTAARVVSAGGAGFDAIFGIVGGNAGRSIIDFGDTDSPLPGRLSYEHNNNAFAFSTNGSERMRLDSSGNLIVGGTSALGTSSGRGNITINGTSSILSFGISGTLSGYVLHDGTDLWFNNATATGAQRFYTNGSERMRLNSSGNLGLGVSPNSWGSSGNLDLGAGAGIAFGGAGGVIVSNAYYNGGWKYASNNYAVKYDQQQNAGAHYWYIAPSGTAGNAISFTQAMTLFASGGLSIGTTADPGAGAIYATGNITAYYSDDRLKNRLGSIESALDKVDQLSGFYYEANETAQQLGYKPKREVGVSAQDVQKVMPEIVSPAPIDPEYLTISYERLVPLLVEAIKELRAEVRALRQ